MIALSSLLTHSRLASARACQRLHHLKYELGYQSLVEIGTLRFGTLVHKGFEAWWKGKQGEFTDASCLAGALAAVQEEKDAFERVKAEALLAAYHERWKQEPYDVLAVEAMFRTELRNPGTGAASRAWELGGKIDVVVRDRRDGLVRIIEHKTSSEDITAGSAYWRRLRMDGQVSIYFVGGQALGFDVAGCIYDVIGKPGQRPLKATPPEARQYTKDGKLYAKQRANDETPDEYRARLVEAVTTEPNSYLARGEVVRLESEMDGALLDIWQLAAQLREASNAGRAPRNPDACSRYGRTCEFFDVCSGAASLDDETMFHRRDDVHPELADADTKPKEEAK